MPTADDRHADVLSEYAAIGTDTTAIEAIRLAIGKRSAHAHVDESRKRHADGARARRQLAHIRREVPYERRVILSLKSNFSPAE